MHRISHRFAWDLWDGLKRQNHTRRQSISVMSAVGEQCLYRGRSYVYNRPIKCGDVKLQAPSFAIRGLEVQRLKAAG